MRAFIKKISYIRKDQNGFSLVELIAAIGISGIIMIGLVILIFQLFIGHARSSGEMTVVRQVQQAGYYISRDVHMANIIDYAPAAPEVVTLTWYRYTYHPDNQADRDGDGYRVIYTIEDGDKLYRYYYEAEEDAEGEVTFEGVPYIYKTFIAEYISNIEINPLYNGNYELTVTASIDGIAGEQVETRVYEIEKRPNVF